MQFLLQGNGAKYLYDGKGESFNRQAMSDLPRKKFPNVHEG